MLLAQRLKFLLRHRVELSVSAEPDETAFDFHTPTGVISAPAAEAIGALSTGIRAMEAHETVRAWAVPSLVALRLMATGNLTNPSENDLHQLNEAASRIGSTPAEGRRLVEAFLEALRSQAPDVASTKQDPGLPSPAPSKPQPVRLTWRLRLTSLDEPTAQAVASASLLLRASAGTAWRDIAQLPDSTMAEYRDALDRLMSSWERTWPAARRLMEPATTISLAELNALRVEASNTLLAHQISVDWPTISSESPRAVYELRTIHSSAPGRFSLSDIMGFTWNLDVAGERLGPADIEAIMTATDEWLVVGGQLLTKSELNKLRFPARLHGQLEAFDALTSVLSGTVANHGIEADIILDERLIALREMLLEPSDEIEQPAGFSGTLRHYQREALEWMTPRIKLGLGGILADDMGLGKTIMVIAEHLHLASDLPTLIVCPASVVNGWAREFAKFAPSQRVQIFHGPDRKAPRPDVDVIITTYGTARTGERDLDAMQFGLVVADEAQHMKNPRSKTAALLHRLNAHGRLALTGTPLENNLTDLWSILHWTTPGLLGSADHFRKQWARPIELHGDPDASERLSRIVAPFILRRRKTDPGIAPELPEKLHNDHLVELTPEQVNLYRAVSSKAMEDLAGASLMARRGLIMGLLTKLKQICNHPAHFRGEPSPGKSGRSAKFDATFELIDEIVGCESAGLLFTQYRRMGDLLSAELTSRGIDHEFLHGGTSIAARQSMVDRFNDGQFPIMILSLKAGGSGLNLTKAEHVIHFDRWWNPAVEDQATDRAHRIGQAKTVHVHRMIATGTIESAIDEVIAAKRELSDVVLGASGQGLTELSDEQLSELIQLRSA